MRYGSLFTGIGGFDLGLDRAGMECRWQVEIDPFCRAVLGKHWPDVPRYEDVRDAGPKLEPVDLICGGFPCQPVSRFGKRAGREDSRWLWPAFRDVLRATGPRYVLVENVPGLLDGGMGDVLGDLADLRYDAEWTVLHASGVGAPHQRARVFILAYPHGVGPRAILTEPQLLRATAGVAHPARGRGLGARWEDAEGVLWPPEPAVGRVADGFPARVDRLRALGNAVVPRVAEWIGRRIMDAHTGRGPRKVT